MSTPVYPMSRFCLSFAGFWMLATLALFVVAIALAAFLSFEIPSGTSIGVQIAVFYIVGDRLGRRTAVLPDGAWYWRAAFFATMISIALSGLLVAIMLIVFGTALLGALSSEVLAGFLGLMLIVLLVFVALSTVAGRFILASTARKSYDSIDPAREF